MTEKNLFEFKSNEKRWDRWTQYLRSQRGALERMNSLPTEQKALASDGAIVNIGLSADARQSIAEELSRALADTYALYLRSQNFHWNVSGPQFASLHLMFGEQYKNLAEAVDVIAERIRALGYFAPGSFTQFLALTSIPDSTNAIQSDEMIDLLIQGHETVTRSLNKVCLLSQRLQDQPTADLVIQRMAAHEKNAWMLRSLLI